MPHPLAGKPAPPSVLIDVDRLPGRVPRPRARTRRSRAAGQLRHQRAPRLLAARLLQRSPHPRRHPGAGRIPRPAADRRSALSWQGHACALRARRGHRTGGARGQRRDHRGPERRRRPHPHAGDLARHPHLQPQPHRRPRRRHRGHPLAQPARRRRLQVQPAQRRPGRHRRHRLDPGPRQRAPARRQPRGPAHPPRPCPRRPHHPVAGSGLAVRRRSGPGAGARTGARRWRPLRGGPAGRGRPALLRGDRQPLPDSISPSPTAAWIRALPS